MLTGHVTVKDGRPWLAGIIDDCPEALQPTVVAVPGLVSNRAWKTIGASNVYVAKCPIVAVLANYSEILAVVPYLIANR